MSEPKRPVQFSIRSLMIGTAFFAIGIASPAALAAQTFVFRDWEFFAHFVGVFGPFLLPIPFIAYVAGRRAISIRLVVVFAITCLIVQGISWSLR